LRPPQIYILALLVAKPSVLTSAVLILSIFVKTFGPTPTPKVTETV